MTHWHLFAIALISVLNIVLFVINTWNARSNERAADDLDQLQKRMATVSGQTTRLIERMQREVLLYGGAPQAKKERSLDA